MQGAGAYLAWSCLLCLTFAPAMHAQQATSIRPLSTSELAGGRLFLQQCSFCHVAGVPRPSAFGPLLSPELITSRGDDRVRESIMKGSDRMPGFQYQLARAQIDNIIAYLKVAPPRISSPANRS